MTQAPTEYDNPVIRGFHPDPSAVRVGSDFYLANSSFEYFPGVPIFHSTDLVNWRKIGHALTRPSQVDLNGLPSSQGIYAPSLRYHDGTFYVITTNVSSDGHLLVTTTDPAGEWSEPVFIEGDGIDPSLFFDDDGTVYFSRHGGGENGGIFQAEIDVTSGRLLTPLVEIWSGTGGIWPEGPHLYKFDDTYYLLVAEGGTSYGHRITVARSSSPSGPFESFPGNPILTHADDPDHPIQATGHGDIVRLEDGSDWIVFLGIRPWDGSHHHLGRETFLAPLEWNADGWPVVNGGARIGLSMSREGLPPYSPQEPEPAVDDFDGDALGLEWNTLRNPQLSDYSLTARPGFLRLSGRNVTLEQEASPTFVGRRQQHLRCRASTRLEFTPEAEGQEAGLALRMNEDNHYVLFVTLAGGQRRVELRGRSNGLSAALAAANLPDGPVDLIVEAYADHFEFFFASDGAEPVALGEGSTTPVSTEEAGGFTGLYIGLFAQTSGASMPPADFDRFEYTPLD